MPTSERECIEALREAAERLGESPTKAQYEELGLTPASATVVRVFGSWNQAKEAAGLETYRSTGPRVGPKPDDVDLPDGTSWGALSVDQRWHYRNAEWNAERSLDRRRRLRAWVNGIKEEQGCARCGEADPSCLDFHHVDADEKEMAITRMVTYGYGRDALRDEMENCEVLCANCHRKEHYVLPVASSGRNDAVDAGPSSAGRNDRGSRSVSDRDRLRAWVHQYKRDAGGCERCDEADPACLDFHHDGAEKGATVAKLVSDGRPKEVVRAEIANCTVLCANCHRKEHLEPPADAG